MRLINDVRFRIGGILIVALLRLGFMVQELVSGSMSAVLIIDNTLIAGVLIWESSRTVVLYTHRWFPLDELSSRRFVWEALILLLLAGVLFVIQSGLYSCSELKSATFYYKVVNNQLLFRDSPNDTQPMYLKASN